MRQITGALIFIRTLAFSSGGSTVHDLASSPYLTTDHLTRAKIGCLEELVGAEGWAWGKPGTVVVLLGKA